MKTIKFMVEIDLNIERSLTEHEILEIAKGVDTAIRRERNEWGILPGSVKYANGGLINNEEVEEKLIRVKPL
jgi:hypothetical protein